MLVNASPRSGFHAFHYAPASSLRQSPSWHSTALSRRQSASSTATSIASPSLPRAKRYVDAATQYSPMEPFDYAAGAVVRAPPSEGDRLEPPAPRGPKPMSVRNNERPPATSAYEQAQAQPRPVKAAPGIARERTEAQAGSAVQPLSPSKRKSADGPGESSAALPNPAKSPSTLSKRPKTDTSPPKVLPIKYELCQAEDIVVLVAHMIGELIETNDALALRTGHLTRFHSRTAPGISVLDYLNRLAKHATLTPPLLLSMVYYIDRLCALYPEFTINTLTVHRFLITAATVAAKGLSDAFWNNSHYAKVGGVRLAELKLLELEFLYRVDWKIVPNPEVLVAYYRGLVERCPGYSLEAEERVGDEDDDVDESVDEEDDNDTDTATDGAEASEDSGDSSGGIKAGTREEESL
ncbi:cyclin-domain-containing protein [Podospora aff. communis PSN243]|uniref:Cyclin-domain-containing protein n=1 Tax=Podospora aff. communis PSN243 TaxID=3040156 RepID=A0AAV9H4Y9_9PEZI|nr:cyclin-domain-containing protein [Podospora aff. communis PSN243]